MAEIDDLLTTVRTRSVLRDPTEARMAISAVAGSLAACLGQPEREALAGLAPVGEEEQLSLTADEFVEEVGRRTGWDAKRSRYAAQAVLSALAENDPQLRPAVLRRMPHAAELFTSPGAPA